MDIKDSGNVGNAIKLRSVLIAVGVYAVATFVTFGIALIALLIAGLVTNAICSSEIESATSASNKFKKRFPFRYFGQTFGDFEHTFHHAEDLQNRILGAIDRQLKARQLVSAIESISIVDIDDDLTAPDSMNFVRADGGNTKRGTTITLVMKFSKYGQMQSIRWWALAGGYVDKDKKFNFIVYSPITILFWIIPYLKTEYDVLGRIRTIYGATFNDMQITTEIRCLHDTVFVAMADELERNGVDTSDIRIQRMQTMNISVSGGRVNIGNVVQGAMNQIAAKVSAARA